VSAVEHPETPDDGAAGGQPAIGPAADGGRGATRAAGPGRGRAFLEAILCSGLPTQVVLGEALLAAGFRPFDEGRLSVAWVVAVSTLDAAVLLGLVFLFLRASGERAREVFLGARRAGREAMLGAALSPVIFMLAVGTVVLLRAAAPWTHNVPENPFRDLIRSPLDAAVFAVVAIGAGGIREEMQRAFVLRRFETCFGGRVAGLVIFSVIFGAGHLVQGIDAAAATAVLGAVWGLIYLTRGSIVAAVVSHSAFNVMEIMVGVGNR
jgi:membrane protease YdiL (CAAX protease family)